MKKALLLATLLGTLVFAFAANAAAPPSFAGTWDLDKAKSQNLPRPWQDATGVTLTITQNDKQITLEPKVMQAEAPAGPTGGPGGGRGFGGMMGPITYNLDGSETTSDTGRGKSTTKAAWSKDGMTLELSVKRTFSGPNGEMTATSTDKLTLSADGKVLTDVRHSESPRGPQDSTLVYNKKS